MKLDTTPEPVAAANTAFDDIAEQFIPLNRLGIAPENLRAAEGPDEDIAQLAETLFLAGQLLPLFVRPGRGKAEDAFMALDGRRRRFAFLALADQGRIPADHPIRVKVLTDKARQVSAAFLPNTEPLIPDLVDVISAVGRLQSKKFSPTEIAKALGRPRDEILGWSVLADLDKTVLTGLRDGRITLRQAKLMTKLSPDDQKQLAEQARSYGHLYDDTVRSRVSGAVITVADRRVRLAGLGAYAAAGGRVERDLFGETPDVLLDPQILQQVWDAQVEPVVDALKAQGVEVFVGGYRGQIPEGFASLPWSYQIDIPEDQADVVEAAESREALAATAVEALKELDAAAGPVVLDYVEAALDHQRALHAVPVSAVTVIPHARRGVELAFHTVEVAPEPETERAAPEAPSRDGQPEATTRRQGDVDIPLVDLDADVSSHALNERYTDLATRGLIRAVADDPQASLILLISRLFANVALQSSADKNHSISTLEADAYRRPGHGADPNLDGEVIDRLEVRRQAYLASGLRPIAWITAMPHGERMTFLAELVAMTLNGREFATHAARHGARAEALEMAELTGYDIRTYWTGDVAFFAAHNKRHLLGMLEKMGAEVAPASGLKKDDLAAFVAEAAVEHQWAPDALSWKAAPLETVDDDPGPDGGAPAARVPDVEPPESEAEDLPAAA